MKIVIEVMTGSIFYIIIFQVILLKASPTYIRNDCKDFGCLYRNFLSVNHQFLLERIRRSAQILNSGSQIGQQTINNYYGGGVGYHRPYPRPNYGGYRPNVYGNQMRPGYGVF